MEPLSAIGLVSSVITFIDFGYEVISAAKEIHAAASGTTAANDHVEFLNTRMEAVATDLAVAKPRRGTSADTQRLAELADKCLGLSNDLKKLLGELRAKNRNSKRQVFGAVVRNMRKKDQKRDLEARLDQCRQQLHLELSQTMRLEFLRRLKEIAQTGRCQDKELRSLNHQVALLKDAVAGLNPDSKLQGEAHTILDLSNSAVSKVLQNSILEALRFEKMESRFDNIEEAHTETFKWLLEDETLSSQTMPTGHPGDRWFTSMKHLLKKDIPLRLEIQKGFTNWLSHGNGIFHISGKPGAGKSTLMKYLSESSEVRSYLDTWADGKELAFASFFFWRHGTEFQKSLQGLLQSLLYSVLDAHPNLTQTVFPTQWEVASNSPGKTIHFRLSEIQKAFKVLTKTPDVYIRHKFVFFIDGLDEFEGHDDSLVKTLFEWAHSGSEDIKICVSSRELPIFQQRFSKCPKFRLHEVTYRDIFLFVYDTLRDNEDVKSMSNPQEVACLGKSLVERAEGVFLWVSLALRLVERGLVLEESVEELERSRDQLPHKLEQLFRVIFDSIQTERDLAKRRKAMRTLYLAVDEIQVPRCKDYLFLTHLSFMDDYDRDPDFPSHIRGDTHATDRNLRLSRCRKQLAGGCRGLLTVRSLAETKVLVRKETVALTHRSLIEFFQLPDVRACIEEHTQGFDRLHFYCQSLIGELKVWSLSQEYEGLEAFPLQPLMQPPKSERLYGNNWLPLGLERLITLYYYIRDPTTLTLFSTIDKLRQLVKADSKSTWEFMKSYNLRWLCDLVYVTRRVAVQCQQQDFFVLVPMQYGLYEFWSTATLEDTLRDTTLELVTTSLESIWLSCDEGLATSVTTPFDRLLRTLATCLADGISANTPMLDDGYFTTPTVWQNLVWHSIVTINIQAPVAPVWLLFVLHGADTSLTLTLEPTYNFSARDKRSRVMLMTGRWGRDDYEIHSPILIDEDDNGILGLAKRQDWSISFKDLSCFWFEPHANSFRRVFEFYENNAGVTTETLRDLTRELGVDAECWQSQSWGDPQPLLRYPWEGVSEIIGFDADEDYSSEELESSDEE